MVEIPETHGTHSTTTHHLHLHSTSIIHFHSHSTPFCHISTERSTDGADILLKGEVKIHQENGEAIWPWCGAGRPAASPSINPTPSLLLLASNTTEGNPPELKIPEAKFIVEFPLVEVVLEKERVWERLSLKVVLKSWEREEEVLLKSGSAVPIKRGN